MPQRSPRAVRLLRSRWPQYSTTRRGPVASLCRLPRAPLVLGLDSRQGIRPRPALAAPDVQPALEARAERARVLRPSGAMAGELRLRQALAERAVQRRSRRRTPVVAGRSGADDQDRREGIATCAADHRAMTHRPTDVRAGAETLTSSDPSLA